MGCKKITRETIDKSAQPWYNIYVTQVYITAKRAQNSIAYLYFLLAGTCVTTIRDTPCGVSLIEDTPYFFKRGKTMPKKLNAKECREYTAGLEYQLSEDATHYAVVGIGKCSATEIVITNKKEHVPVTHISSRAFENCRQLTAITIPDSITDIGARVFTGCKLLADMVIPNGVTRIAEALFSGCCGLKSITISNSVLTIEDGAFAGCRSLKSVVLPHSVMSVGDSSFDGCCGLTSITLPGSLTRIGNGAFDGCRKLNKIYFQGTKAEWKAIEKEPDWNNWTGDFTVICTDGKLDKDGNEIE